MASTNPDTLKYFLRQCPDPLANTLLDKLKHSSGTDIASIYHEALPLVERTLWDNIADSAQLDNYQKLFRELEAQLSEKDNDERHHFILYIPVADRPRQLLDCLNSIVTLCRLYHYGGVKNNRFQKISVLIADDSKLTESIEQHKKIVAQFNAQGLETFYFGQEEQRQQIRRLPDETQRALHGVLGDAESQDFFHKGSPRMRNIINLKLNELKQQYGKVLFYSLDSDQEFQVKISDGERDIYALNYFYYLDKIFQQTDACIVTGKVVGDPPVSPAVMMVNFLQDVISFIRELSTLRDKDDCHFHHAIREEADDAAYHDMPELFGFTHKQPSCHYNCELDGAHDNGDCLRRFAERLNSFFYGEHPTRKTHYKYHEVFASLTPARTVYPGNYVFNTEGLNYFIPFAPLKLRMNGPVMGRIIKAELKQRFVSANLPMLHRRTVADTGQSEFRPDILQDAEKLDLSGEFARQYFGDVMLFSMQALTEQGYPLEPINPETIAGIVRATEGNMQQRYQDKHRSLLQKLAQLKSLFYDPDNWWRQEPGFDAVIQYFDHFIANVEHNFSDDAEAYKLINSDSDKQARLKAIIRAIENYPQDKACWLQALSYSAATK